MSRRLKLVPGPLKEVCCKVIIRRTSRQHYDLCLARHVHTSHLFSNWIAPRGLCPGLTVIDKQEPHELVNNDSLVNTMAGHSTGCTKIYRK
jgi:hypothetical protein